MSIVAFKRPQRPIKPIKQSYRDFFGFAHSCFYDPKFRDDSCLYPSIFFCNNSTISAKPPCFAKSSGVRPSSIRAFIVAPASTSTRASSNCPLWAAECSGVTPLPWAAFASAPCASNNFTSSRSCRAIAACKGVIRLGLLAAWLASAPASNRMRDASYCPK
jgi:hypothetical protein